MLVSCIVFLKVKEEVLVPPSLGQVLYAFFLDRVRALEPGLSEMLHGPFPIKPFTVSPLAGKVVFEDNRWRLFPGEVYSFRVTSIFPELSVWLKDVWVYSLPEELVLAGAKFSFVGWTMDNEKHPWAGNTSYDEVYNSAICRTGALNKVTLEFYSPTTFRVGGRNYPLPDPQLVFMNLLQKWSTFSPIHLGENYINFIKENVFPGAYKLQTRIMHFDNYKQVGFTGTCSFSIRKQKEEIWARVLFMLAKFSYFAGIGYKTTMGMGQVRCNPGKFE